MLYDYVPTGICPSKIHIELDDMHIITDVKFDGGCPGNTQAVSKLLIGMPAEQAIDILKGIKCGKRPTSCPDQLACALSKMIQ